MRPNPSEELSPVARSAPHRGRPTGETAARLRFAIVGTWGVPAKYGGFETLAEQLARNISPSEAEIDIYGQKTAFTPAERAGDFHGHRRIWLPLSAKGPVSMVHDALQVFRAAFVERHDRLLLLGTSGAWALPVVRLFRPRIRVVSNIDGLEWRRAKFSPLVRGLLKWLERRAVRNSDVVIADNDALVPIVRDEHAIEPAMIAYGGDQIRVVDSGEPRTWFLTLQRIEPENNGDIILEGMRRAQVPFRFLGNWKGNAFARELHAKYAGEPCLQLLSPIYDQDGLAPLRGSCAVYVHGHSVGGTNPSLAEALFHADRILAFDCVFNRATLDGEGGYFSDSESLAELARQPDSGRISPSRLEELRERYRWRTIALQYMNVLEADGNGAAARG